MKWLIAIIFLVSLYLFTAPKDAQAAVGCAFGPGSVQAGDTNALGVITTDMPGTVQIRIRTFGGPYITIGSVAGGAGLGTGGGSVTVPTVTAATAYQVYADNGFGPITCADPGGTVGGNLTVTAAPGGGGCSAADVNNDGTIDVTDAQLIAAGVGAPYNPNFDLNGDGSVTVADVNIATGCMSPDCGNADVNSDGRVDVTDAQLVASAVGGPYNPDYDMNGDNLITVADVNLVNDCMAGIGEGIGENPCPGGTCETALGSIPTETKEFAERLLSIATGIAGGLAFILMVIGAIRILVSQGDPQKLNGGREMMIAAVAGLLFLIFSIIILRFIGITVLNIPS